MSKWIVCLVFLCACGSLGIGGGDVQRAMNAYRARDYELAARRCAELEQPEREGDFNDKGFLRMVVFCGLTHYQRGERDKARTMLERGRKLLTTAEPEWIELQTVAELEAAITNLKGAP